MKSHNTFFKKFLAVFLATLFFCLAALSFLGIFFAAEYDFYSSTRNQLRHVFLSNALTKELHRAYEIFEYGNDPVRYYEDTNFCFTIQDGEQNVLTSNYHGEPIVESVSFPYTATIETYDHVTEQSITVLEKQYILTGYVISTAHYTDLFEGQLKLVDFIFAMRFIMIVICAVSLIALIVCWIYLLHAAGKRARDDNAKCGIVEKIPFDLYVLLYLAVAIAAIFLCDLLQYSIATVLWIMWLALVICAAHLLILAFCMSLVVRIKTKTLCKHTLTYILFSFLFRKTKRLLHMIPLVWKTVIAFAVNLILDIVLILLLKEFSCFVILFKDFCLFPILIYAAYTFLKLRRGAQEIEKGDLDHQIDTQSMVMEFKAFGETLNNIGNGLSKAVDERMRSERMKTELITNVSHDIKTPLTSIINYVDLLKKQEIANETAQEYIEVIDRQASRLKKLITDLVEASKASTGNIQVQPEILDVGVLLQQAAGEYHEKFENASLTPLVRIPEESIHISADGRLLWRVFDNLLSNICKYSLPGTRVYLSTAVYGSSCLISFKNISQTELNISPEELIERFVRADNARSTEGNGLGLSIAQSLVELQGGRLEIVSDGDLFKVNLQFPIAQTAADA